MGIIRMLSNSKLLPRSLKDSVGISILVDVFDWVECYNTMVL